MAFCTSTKIEHYHNQGYSPTPISSDLKLGFSNIKTSYENGILQCSFRRVKEIAAEIKHFSVIDKKYYILFAHGTGTGQYGYHSNNKVASDEEFDFNVKVQALTTGTTNEQLEVGSFEKNEWQLSWTDAGDFTDFVFRTKLASGTNVWTAFALSKDKKMVFYSKPN